MMDLGQLVIAVTVSLGKSHWYNFTSAPTNMCTVIHAWQSSRRIAVNGRQTIGRIGYPSQPEESDAYQLRTSMSSDMRPPLQRFYGNLLAPRLATQGASG